MARSDRRRDDTRARGPAELSRRGLLGVALGLVAAPAAAATAAANADIFEEPYSLRSPWKCPVSSGAIFALETDLDQVALRAIAATGLCTVHALSSGCSQPWYDGRLPGAARITIAAPSVSDPYWLPGFTMLSPTGPLVAPSSATGHMSIYDPTPRAAAPYGIVWHGYDCVISKGSSSEHVTPGCTITARLGKVNSASGDGLTTIMGSPGHGRYGWGDCVNRAWEFTRSGGPLFQHVGRIKLSPGLLAARFTLAGQSYGASWRDFPFPTFNVDFSYATPGGGEYAGTIPPGVLFAIPPWVNVSALTLYGVPLTPTQRALATQFQQFGVMFRDTTGPSGGKQQVALDLEPTTPTGYVNEARSVMPLLIRLLAILRNPSATYPYWGGGRLLYPPPRPLGAWDTVG